MENKTQRKFPRDTIRIREGNFRTLRETSKHPGQKRECARGWESQKRRFSARSLFQRVFVFTSHTTSNRHKKEHQTYLMNGCLYHIAKRKVEFGQGFVAIQEDINTPMTGSQCHCNLIGLRGIGVVIHLLVRLSKSMIQEDTHRGCGVSKQSVDKDTAIQVTQRWIVQFGFLQRRSGEIRKETWG